jgi:putative acetyltransferase
MAIAGYGGGVMSKITVRSETADDIRAIDVVNLSAFEGDTEAQLVGAVRASPGFVPELSLVAEFNGRIVGHVLLSKVHYRHAGGEQDILALAPMSVVPSQSHRGIGKALLDEALLRARNLGFPAVVVVGQPEYYARFGFLPGARWQLQCTPPVAAEVLTAMELVEGGLRSGGRIVYPPLFAAIF